MVKQLLLAAALTASTAAFALVNPSSYVPRPGEVTEFGTICINFPQEPTANPECTGLAKLMLGDEDLFTLSSTDSHVQIRIGDLAPTQAVMAFTMTRISSPGEYTMVIPEGFFTFPDGDVNAEISIKYSIAKPVSWSVSPIPGVRTSVPRTICLTFDGVTEIVDNNTTADGYGLGAIRFDTPDGANRPTTTCVGNKIYFSIGEMISGDEEGDTNPDPAEGNEGNNSDFTAPGEYQLWLSYGNLTLTLENGKQVKNDEIQIKWFIADADMPEVTPAPGKVYELSQIVLHAPEGKQFGFVQIRPSVFPVEENGVVNTNKEARIVAFNNPLEYPTRYNTELTYQLPAPITTPGKYAVVFNQGSVVYDGESHSIYDDKLSTVDYFYIYEVVPTPNTPATTLTETETTNVISNFSIFFDATNVEINPDADAAQVIDTKWDDVFDEYKVSYNVVTPEATGYGLRAPAVKTEVVVSVRPAITKKGNYSVKIPESAFICDGIASKAFAQKFKVDGTLTAVDEVISTEALDVYGIDGTVVAKGIDEASFNALPKGLYIVNGKKVIK